MSLDATSVVERRRLRRRLSFWRITALVLVAVAAIAAGYRFSGLAPGKHSAHVARVDLSGVIFGSDRREKMFEEYLAKGYRAVDFVLQRDAGFGRYLLAKTETES